MMPNVDGLTVCRRLRARRVTLPILMLTARHEVSDRVAGLDAGADDYLVKPFALDELLGAAARAAPPDERRRAPTTSLRVGDLVARPARPHRAARRAPARPHQDRVRPARAAHGERRHRARPRRRSTSASGASTSRPSSRSLDVYIGYLRAQDRGRGRAPARAHRARRRLRADPEAMSLVGGSRRPGRRSPRSSARSARSPRTSRRRSASSDSVDESLLARRAGLAHPTATGPAGFDARTDDHRVRRR